MSTLILYGSQTGTTKDFAYLLYYSLREHLPVDLFELDSISPSTLLNVRNLIILCSTTGQGEFPVNASKFWKFLKRKHPDNLLNHLKIHVCGFGDSGYSQFNLCGRKLWIRLTQLGAQEGIRGEVNEAKADWENWFQSWALNVAKDLDVDLGDSFVIGGEYNEEGIDISREPLHKVELLEQYQGGEHKGVHSNEGQFEVIENTVITKEMPVSQTVHKIRLRCNKPFKYNPGDIIQITPLNDATVVNEFLERQHLVEFANRKVSTPQLGITTLEELLYNLNLQEPPRRFFANCWQFATDPREREKLYELAQFAEADQLHNYISRSHRSISEVLQEFFSFKMSINWLVDSLGFIRPREYTISGCYEKEIELTITRVKYNTILRTARIGLASNFICNLKVNSKLNGKIISKNIKLPMGKLLLISTGAGIAGTKSIIESRNDQNELILYTGHRFQEKDFLYGELWQNFSNLKVFGCFSRNCIDQNLVRDNITFKKGYVQHVLAEKIPNDIEAVYVCGSSGKMPAELRQILKEKLDIDQMERNGCYIEDVW
ncbi:NAPDH-dependent diflavin reductase [Martiniozyma asiatica (nom. inval.)]|nr:NAPDH-dependent diflavin reductase [Martiniozyma asiatica]